ncbi:MAG: ABC transporter permease [Acidobacteria bacterium]|nr:ABC transporter permease [Acidobacteriota bacterium]
MQVDLQKQSPWWTRCHGPVFGFWCRLREALGFAFDALRANKVRTGLTALGMVIGTGSVILVTTIALTSRDYVLSQIEGVGSNMIYAHLEGDDSVSGSGSISDALTLQDLAAIRQSVPHLSAVAAIILGRDRLMLDHIERDVALIGTDADFRTVRNLKILQGRFLDAEDVARRNKVCTVTEKLAKTLFPDGWAEGRLVKVHGLEFTIIGVFKEGAQTFGQSEITQETIILPISVMTYFTGTDAVDQIYASADHPSNVVAATKAIGAAIRSRHRPSAVYRVENLTEILAAAGNIAMALTLVLLLISAIALIISGIGIMNIMLVTVSERTHEIGLKMAVGAGRRAIRWQFLSEALVLSIVGGSVGIVMGVSVPLAVRYFADLRIPISGLSILIAFLVSCVVGVVFGMIPAERASRLNPTEALRHE